MWLAWCARACIFIGLWGNELNVGESVYQGVKNAALRLFGALCDRLIVPGCRRAVNFCGAAAEQILVFSVRPLEQ